MSADAVVTMVVGMLAIWGGLVASVVLVLRRSRARARAEKGDAAPPSRPDL